jgi:hypothetical protein
MIDEVDFLIYLRKSKPLQKPIKLNPVPVVEVTMGTGLLFYLPFPAGAGENSLRKIHIKP